jgi:hypothetical protein
MAAWCLGPLADRGASLAIGGAELLGDALDIFPDADEALRWWERSLRHSCGVRASPIPGPM